MAVAIAVDGGEGDVAWPSCPDVPGVEGVLGPNVGADGCGGWLAEVDGPERVVPGGAGTLDGGLVC
jgi:hypothetical protein